MPETMRKPKKQYLRVTMPDGSQWDVPVDVIARNRAEHYKGEFDNDVERSLKEDTLPFFARNLFEIEDWAANNMNWDDVSEHATEAGKSKNRCDYEEGWANGEKEIIEK